MEAMLNFISILNGAGDPSGANQRLLSKGSKCPILPRKTYFQITGVSPKLSELFALRACEGSASQAWAGVEELREQNGCRKEKRRRWVSCNGKWRSSCAPLLVPEIRSLLRLLMSNSRDYPQEPVS